MTQRPWHVRRRWRAPALLALAATAVARCSPPTPLGSFSITQLGDAADKIGKDTNFRGLTVYGNVVYFTKAAAATA